MSIEERIEKQLSEYETKIKKIMFQQTLDKVLTLALYILIGAGFVGLMILLNKH